MTDELTSAGLEAAARRVCAMLDARASEFNQLDAATGDGDMGTTLQIVARAVSTDDSPFAGDLGQAFGRLAITLAKTSGSSLCAVVMTGLMSLSRTTAGRSRCTAAELIAGLDAALDAMQSRSRAGFGDKTILDGLKAVVEAGQGAASLTELGVKASAAGQAALEQFRRRPSQIGRARLAADKGVGLDDPGMVVLLRSVVAARGG